MADKAASGEGPGGYRGKRQREDHGPAGHNEGEPDGLDILCVEHLLQSPGPAIDIFTEA